MSSTFMETLLTVSFCKHEVYVVTP